MIIKSILSQLGNEALCKEFIAEEEYLRNISDNDITRKEYEERREINNTIRQELANRGLSYTDIYNIANNKKEVI